MAVMISKIKAGINGMARMFSVEHLAECGRLSLEERVVYLPNSRCEIYNFPYQTNDGLTLNVTYVKLPGFSLDTPCKTSACVPENVEDIIYYLKGHNQKRVKIPQIRTESYDDYEIFSI